MLVFGFLLDCLSHVKKLFQTLVIAGDPVWNRMWLRRLTRPSICNVLVGAAAQACFFCCTERSGSFEQRLTAARGRWRGFARGSTLFTAMTDVSVYNNMMYYVLQFKG